MIQPPEGEVHVGIVIAERVKATKTGFEASGIRETTFLMPPGADSVPIPFSLLLSVTLTSGVPRKINARLVLRDEEETEIDSEVMILPRFTPGRTQFGMWPIGLKLPTGPHFLCVDVAKRERCRILLVGVPSAPAPDG